MAIYDSGLMAKIVRLRSLQALSYKVTGNAARLVQEEMGDLRRDILGSGVTEDELTERTAPGVQGF